MPSTWSTVCGGIWELCGTGLHQSPIDIDTSTVVANDQLMVTPLTLQYQEVYHTRVVNLGTTIHVDVSSNNTLTGGPLPVDEHLVLNQLHFHAPGEHRINGAQSAAEVHLVHESITGTRAVLVIRVNVGTNNPWFEQIFTVRDLPVGGNTTIDINPLQLFPHHVLEGTHLLTHSNYYSYSGSLTTPPCTEGVHWIVLADPIFASVDQIDNLQRWEGINNRPIQKYNGTVYRPNFVVNAPTQVGSVEDIRHMGLVIGVSFLLGLVAFFGIVGIAILALHLRDISDKRDFYGAQQFELQPTAY